MAQWANRVVEASASGRNGQGSNPCKDAFLWYLPLLRAIGLKYEKSLLVLVNFDVDLNLWIEKNYL